MCTFLESHVSVAHSLSSNKTGACRSAGPIVRGDPIWDDFALMVPLGVGGTVVGLLTTTSFRKPC